MVLDEQELRYHLAAAADHASAPRFTAGDLTGRIRRQRAKIAGLVSGSLLAAAAIAVAVPVALSGARTQPEAQPRVVPFQLSFTMTVNGQSRVFPENGSQQPSFTVTPGESLRIRIGVTVPAHVTVTALWLGISNGLFTAPGPGGERPDTMHPVLAHARMPLSSGSHTFRLTWTVPAVRPGTTFWLVTGWTARQDYANVGQGIAVFHTVAMRRS